MNSEEIIHRIDQLIDKGRDSLANNTVINSFTFLSEGPYHEFRSASLSLISNIFGSEHTYYIEFNKNVSDNQPKYVKIGIGILRAARDDIQNGWFFTTRGLISAEVFSDFLSMADHLLDEGYKDPAAVMAGSVLEEHLRQLCNAHEIDVETDNDGKMSPKKADRLNSELTKAGAYNKLDQKQITSWLDLRNKAAHGHYDEYSKEQVALMLQGVTDFMTRVRP